MKFFGWAAWAGVVLTLVACGGAPEAANPAPQPTGAGVIPVLQSGICPQKRNTPRAPAALYPRANPLQATAENRQQGETLFQRTAKPFACKTCHGAQGNGLGDPDFESTPPARNFTCAATMRPLPDGQLFWIIRNGSPGTSMPAHPNLSATEIWQLVLYIRGFATP